MYLIESDILALRHPSPSDLDRFYTWTNDGEGQICAAPKYSRFELWQYLQNPSADEAVRLIVVKKSSEEAIGYVESSDFVGVYIDRNCRGNGYGSAALRLLCGLVGGQLRAQIAENNKASQKIFAKAGFSLENTNGKIGLWTKPSL